MVQLPRTEALGCGHTYRIACLLLAVAAEIDENSCSRDTPQKQAHALHLFECRHISYTTSQKNQGDWCDQVVLAWPSPSNGVVCWQLPTFPTWNEQFRNSWRRSAFRWPVRVVSLPRRPRLKHIETLPAASRPQNPSAEGPLKHSTRKLSRHKELPLEVFACLSRLNLGRDFVRIRKLRGFSC